MNTIWFPITFTWGRREFYSGQFPTASTSTFLSRESFLFSSSLFPPLRSLNISTPVVSLGFLLGRVISGQVSLKSLPLNPECHLSPQPLRIRELTRSHLHLHICDWKVECDISETIIARERKHRKRKILHLLRPNIHGMTPHLRLVSAPQSSEFAT